jgi:cbb3-type cytochrome oxidase subunit 3
MNISWDLNATTIVLLAINFVGLIWFAFSTQATATAAHKKADHAHERITALAEA